MNPILKAKLGHVIEYYNSTRGVGHTRVLFRGVGSEPTLVMGSDRRIVDTLLRGKPNVIPLSWGSLSAQLYGRNIPLALDNSAVITILYECLTEIVRLEGVIKEREEELMRR